MNLVDEENGLAAVKLLLFFGFFDQLAQFRQSFGDGVEARKGTLRHFCDDRSEGCFATAGAAPEDDRGEAVCLDGAAQQFSLADERILPDDLVEGLRPHAVGQRCV